MLATNPVKPSLPDEDRDIVRKQLIALRPFEKLDHPVLPYSYIKALLLVGAEEGLTVSEYADKAGVSSTVMTRNLLDIGALNRQRQPGLNLIEQVRDPLDLRKHRAKLTPTGRKLLHDMIAVWRTAFK